MEKKSVKLKDGTPVSGDVFGVQEYEKLKMLYRKWVDINSDLKILGGRKMNVPDVLSEGLYCYFFDAVRTNGTAHSYDAVDENTGEGIQVKAGSVETDCTSFGPTSTWDRLIFLDFASTGEIDGKVLFYEIGCEDVYGIVVNKTKGETFADQQAQGRRPRFSVKKKIIQEKKLVPIKKIDLEE